MAWLGPNLENHLFLGLVVPLYKGSLLAVSISAVDPAWFMMNSSTAKMPLVPLCSHQTTKSPVTHGLVRPNPG